MEILLVPSECRLHWHFRSRLWVVLSASKKETFRTANTFTLQWRNKQTNKQTGLTFQNTPAGYSDLSSQIKHDILYPNWMGIPVMLTVVVKMIMLHYGPAVSWVLSGRGPHRAPPRPAPAGVVTRPLCSYRGASDHEAPRNPGTLLNSVGHWSRAESGVQLHGRLEPQGGSVLLSWKIPPERQVSEGWK